MDDHLEKRLQEVQKRLKTVLDDLRVEARLRLRPLRAHYIEFTNSNGSLWSPVLIKLTKNALEDGPEPWTGSRLVFDEFEEEPIGETGWSYLRPSMRYTSMDFYGDESEIFSYIEDELRDYGLLRRGETHSDLTENQCFYEAFHTVDFCAGEMNSNAVRCERVEGNMIYAFNDNNGREWRLTFEPEQAILTVDNDTFGNAKPWDKAAISDVLREARRRVGMNLRR